MSFWDEFTEISGSWISADEKDIIMNNGIPFEITGVIEDQANQYGPRYVATAKLPATISEEAEAWGELVDRNISFPIGKVESRNRMLAQMMEYLGSEDAEPVMVKLEKQGQSILIRQA